MGKVKLPLKINVYGLDVQVKKDKTLIENDNQGFYDSGVISICPTLNDHDTLVAYIHECIHAIFDRCSISEGVHETLEEIIADTIAKFMVENFEVKPKGKKK